MVFLHLLLYRIKKNDISKNNLMVHIKALVKKEQTKPKSVYRKIIEIIKELMKWKLKTN